MTHLNVLSGPNIVGQNFIDCVGGVELVPPDVAGRVLARHLGHQAHYQAPVLAQPAARFRRRLESCHQHTVEDKEMVAGRRDGRRTVERLASQDVHGSLEGVAEDEEGVRELSVELEDCVFQRQVESEYEVIYFINAACAVALPEVVWRASNGS